MNCLNLQRFIGLFLAFSLVANYGYSQQKEQTQTDESAKKVIIIKKSKDENGKVKTEKIIRSGDDIEEFHFDGKEGKVIIEEIEGGDGQEIRVTVNPEEEIQLEQNVNVEIKEINGEKHLKIKVHPEGGEEKVIEWKGEGEIPEDIRKKLEEDGVFLHELHEEHSGEKGTFLLKEGTEGENFQWRSIVPGGPFLGVVSAQEVEVTVIVDENGEEKTTESSGDEVDGVLIGEVVEESAAAQAGLQTGDILKSIDGQSLNDFSDLVEFMEGAEVGQKVSLGYERNGQVQQTEATLQERNDAMAQNIIIEKMVDKEEEMEGDGQVFIFKSEDGNLTNKIHKRHKIVVITRGKESGDKEILELPKGTLPEAELQKDLELRDFKLFPNPTDGKLRLRFYAEPLPTVVKISDLNGKRLYRERLNRFDGQYDQNIDLTDLPAGLLLLTIEQGGKVYTEQLVLK